MMELNLKGNQCVPIQEQPADQLSQLKSCFGEMLASGLFTDVKVICGSFEISAHKSVLSCRIPFLRDALMHDTVAEDMIEIPPEISPDIVKQIIGYAYFIQPMVTMENAQDLFEAAAFFRIEDLWEFCDQFIAKRILLTAETCLAVQNYAVVRGAKMLKSKTEAFTLVHLADISRTAAFSVLSEEDITSILDTEDVYGAPKETVFWELFIGWIEGDVENRKTIMSKLLGLLRLPSLGVDVITKEVLPHACITSDPVCEQMVQNVLLYKANPGDAVVREECEAAFNLQQRCKQTDRIYRFSRCVERSDDDHITIYQLQDPDEEVEWVSKAWKGFPIGYRANFHHVVAVDYVVYFVTKDNGALLSYNTVTETWTVIQGDAGRPDLLKMRALCAINGKLVAACGPTLDDKQMLIYGYDPLSNSWRQNTLNEPTELDEDNNITCCGVTSGDNGTEMLCVFDRFQGPLLVDVQTGNIVKHGRIYIEDAGDVDLENYYVRDWFDGFGIVSFNGKVYVAGNRSIKVYDVALDEWSSLPGLNVLKNVKYLLVVNGYLYAVEEANKWPDIEYSIEYIDLTDDAGQWQLGPNPSKHCFNSIFVACQYHP